MKVGTHRQSTIVLGLRGHPLLVGGALVDACQPW
jgi:hypothetical protein